MMLLICDAVVLYQEAGSQPATELFRDMAPAGSEGAERGLGDWHGHLLLLDRRQCVTFCHDLTRYVLFLPGLPAA